VIKQTQEERELRKLARDIESRAIRHKSNTDDHKYLVWDLEHIAEMAQRQQVLIRSLLGEEKRLPYNTALYDSPDGWGGMP
jgi:hypothetical protein